MTLLFQRPQCSTYGPFQALSHTVEWSHESDFACFLQKSFSLPSTISFLCFFFSSDGSTHFSLHNDVFVTGA